MLAIHGENFHSWAQKAVFRCEREAVVDIPPSWHVIYKRIADYLESNQPADQSLLWLIEGTGEDLADMVDFLLRFQDALVQEMLPHNPKLLVPVFQWFSRLCIILVEKGTGSLSRMHSLTQPMETIFYKARDGMYISNEEGQFLHANEALLNLFGYDDLDALRKVVIDRDLYMDKSQRQVMLDHLMEDGFYDRHEFRFRNKAGEECTALESCYLVEPKQGQKFIVGLLMDISEDKEKALQVERYTERLEAKTLEANLSAHATKKRYDALLDMVGDPTLVIRAEGFSIMAASRSFYKVFGYKKRESEGLGLKQLFDPAAWQKIYPRLIDVQNRSHVHLGELEAVTASSERLLVSGSVLVHQDPEEIQFLVQLSDLRELRQAQTGLKLMVQNQKFLLDELPFCVLFFNQRGEIEFVNKFLRSQLGFSKEQLKNFDFINELFAVEEQKMKFRKYVQRFLQGQHVQGMPIRLKRKQGDTLDFHLKTVTFQAGPNHAPGFVAFLSEQTKTRALAHAQKEIESMKKGVVSETFQAQVGILQEQLQRSENRMIQWHDLLDEMVERMGIGMETALGFSSVLLESANVPRGNSENERFLFNQMKDLEHMLFNADQFRRLLKGDIPLKPQQNNVLSFFYDACKRLKPAHLRASLHWVVEDQLENDEMVGHFDPILVERILYQAISNAASFTKKGAIHVRLGAQEGHIQISVEDTGCGVEHTDLGRVWEPFYRGLQPPQNGFKGLGLGLFLAKQWSEAMGSRLQMQSQVNSGTTVTFELCPLD